MQCVEEGLTKPGQVYDHLIKQKKRPATASVRSLTARSKERSNELKLDVHMPGEGGTFIPFVQERTTLGELLLGQKEKEEDKLFEGISRGMPKRARSA